MQGDIPKANGHEPKMSKAASVDQKVALLRRRTDGSGSSPVGKSMKLRDLRSAEVQKLTDTQLQGIISKGKGKMPAFEKSLGADTCKALVGHLRELAKKK